MSIFKIDVPYDEFPFYFEVMLEERRKFKMNRREVGLFEKEEYFTLEEVDFSNETIFPETKIKPNIPLFMGFNDEKEGYIYPYSENGTLPKDDTIGIDIFLCGVVKE